METTRLKHKEQREHKGIFKSAVKRNSASSYRYLIIDFGHARYYNSGNPNLGLSKEKPMAEKRQMMEVCKCEKCGNEAEMIVTCELVPVEDPQKKAAGVEYQEKKSFTCEKCGNEADMIIDM
jgi:hypothetical protein